MKQRIISLAVIAAFALTPALLAGNAAPQVSISPQNALPRLIGSQTPTKLDYSVTVNNPSSDPITLRSIQLRSVGQGGYTVDSGIRAVGEVIPANSVRTVTVSVWGRTTRLSRDNAPVTLRGVAFFNTSMGKTRTQFTEYVVHPTARSSR